MLMQILVITEDWLDQNLNGNTKTTSGYGKLEMDATVYSEASQHLRMRLHNVIS